MELQILNANSIYNLVSSAHGYFPDYFDSISRVVIYTENLEQKKILRKLENLVVILKEPKRQSFIKELLEFRDYIKTLDLYAEVVCVLKHTTKTQHRQDDVFIFCQIIKSTLCYLLLDEEYVNLGDYKFSTDTIKANYLINKEWYKKPDLRCANLLLKRSNISLKSGYNMITYFTGLTFLMGVGVPLNNENVLAIADRFCVGFTPKVEEDYTHLLYTEMRTAHDEDDILVVEDGREVFRSRDVAGFILDNRKNLDWFENGILELHYDKLTATLFVHEKSVYWEHFAVIHVKNISDSWIYTLVVDAKKEKSRESSMRLLERFIASVTVAEFVSPFVTSYKKNDVQVNYTEMKEVDGYFRRLPVGYKASDESKEKARQKYKSDMLPTGYTYVNDYERQVRKQK